MILDAIGLVAALAYLICLGGQLFCMRGAATSARLYTALTWCLCAVAAQMIHLAADILDTDSDGWMPVGISAVLLLISLVTSWFIAARAARAEGGAR